jgi:hypothetical protein
MANVGKEHMNSKIRILPLHSVNGLLGEQMNGYGSRQLLVLRIVGTISWPTA